MVQGYQLELTSILHNRGAPFPLINHQHQSAVEEEVQKLLTKGAIVKVQERCSAGNQERWILLPVENLKTPNQFTVKAHFRINMLKDLLLKDNWLASTIDFKKGCLPFSSSIVGTGNATPLCLAGADIRIPMPPIWVEHCSPKLLKPMVDFLRWQGIHLVIFLYDMLVLAQLKENLVDQMSQTVQLFNLLGFTINHKKSQIMAR